MTKRIGGRLIIPLQIAISGLLIAYLAHSITLDAFTNAVQLISPRVYIESLAFLAINHLIGMYRLKLLLTALNVPISVRSAMRLTWLGLFASNFLPSTIGGDALIASSLRRHKSPLGPVLMGLILNRVASVIALAATLPLLYFIPDLAGLRDIILRCAAFLSLAVAVFVVVVIGLYLGCIPSLQINARLERSRQIAVTLIRQMFAIKRVVAVASLLSVLMLFASSASVAVLADTQSPQTTYMAIFGIVLIFLAVQMLPISFNGIGLQESTVSFCLVSLGWTLSTATALSVAIRLTSIAITLPGLPIAVKAAAGTWSQFKRQN